ncbi:MAG TPA: dTDP-4-dehydrorhamnose 3,5-epimerase, partial [Marinobacter hydrocarbonoclasticus]|nr:dTDP-4-dehydrorhamnose 3,5-epimerase [Marinobacter nauticus]
VSEVLSDTNHRMMWIPPGFAHGFLVRSEQADFQYKCTDFYAPEFERCIRWDDENLDIDWECVETSRLIISDKDAAGRPFRELFP